jgi:hypothetical protein
MVNEANIDEMRQMTITQAERRVRRLNIAGTILMLIGISGVVLMLVHAALQ